MTPQETAHAIAAIVGAPMLAAMILFREKRIERPTRTHTGKIERQRVRTTTTTKGNSKP
jgi:hypothetical protein